MADEKDAFSLLEVWRDIGTNIQVLGISGVAGAFVRAALAPKETWRRRVAQGIAGAASAVFFGAMFASAIEGFVEKPVYAWLASGFLFGIMGEAGMKLIQDKLLKFR